MYTAYVLALLGVLGKIMRKNFPNHNFHVFVYLIMLLLLRHSRRDCWHLCSPSHLTSNLGVTFDLLPYQSKSPGKIFLLDIC